MKAFPAPEFSLNAADIVFVGDGERINLQDLATAAEKWQKLFPVGVTKHRADFPGGKIEFTSEMLARMVSNYIAEGQPERAVNYFHRGSSNVPGSIEEKVASGWLRSLELRADGLYGLISWTERAKKLIAANELRYLSPEFNLNGKSKATGKDQGPTLTGAALLNDPFLTELPRVAASENVAPEKHKMNEKLLALLKLSATATPEEIEKAITDLLARAEGSEVKLSESATKVEELEGSLLQLQASVSEKDKELLGLKTAARKSEVGAYVEKLLKAGRISPAIRENVTALGESSGIEAIKFFEKAAPVVTTGERGVTGSVEEIPSDKKAAAAARFSAKRAEYEAKGMKFTDAHNAAKVDLKEDFALAFSAV